MKTIEKRYMVPFLLVSSLFLLWGLANSMTDTLIAAFKNVMQMSDIHRSLSLHSSAHTSALPCLRRFSSVSTAIRQACYSACRSMLLEPSCSILQHISPPMASICCRSMCSQPAALSLRQQLTHTSSRWVVQRRRPEGSTLRSRSIL